MTCPDENVLTALVALKLSPDERRLVLEHLDACPACFVITSELARFDDEPGGEEATPATTSPEAAVPGETFIHERIGRYRLESFLGQGAMGRVYVAHDTQLDRRVALKLLTAKATASQEARGRMLREARAMAKLAHPNVVTVYDAGEDEGQTFLAMELVMGVTLATWLTERTRTWREVLKVLLEAGIGLAAAHAAGIVHRDFKPANVLLDRSGRVAVADFGLAAVAGGVSPEAGPRGAPALDRSELSTATGTIMGTPRYMSPEQHAGQKVDARTDQFSFAVAAYAALYGEPPFEGRTSHELRDAILYHRVTEPALEPSRGVPAAVRRALLRGLSAAPEDRYPTLSELLSDLRAALATEETTASSRSSRRGRFAFAAVTLALVGAALAGTAAARHAALGQAARAPSTAAVPLVTKSSPATTTGGRTTVVLLATEYRATDPLLEGTVDAILEAALYPSTRLDAYAGPTLKELMTELDPRASGWTDELMDALTVRQLGDVVTVRTSVVRDGAEWRISMDARSERSLAVLMAAEERANGLPEIVTATQRLGLALRLALGDPPAAEEGPPRLSTSLEAVHAWALARQLLAANEATQSREHAQRAVEKDPSFAEAHAALARALHTDNQTPSAAREYEAALRDPEGLSAHDRLVVLGDSYAALDRHLQAIAAYEQALARWPGELMVEARVVRSAIRSSDWTLALELAKRAARDHPGVKTREVLVASYLNANQIEDAAREGEAVLEELPHTSTLLFVDTALAEALRDRAPRARELWDQLAAKDAEYADEGRADLALYEGRLDDAARMLTHWIDDALAQHDPGLARTEYLTLAELRLRQGKRAAAALAATAAASGSEAEDALGHEYEIAHALAASGLGAPALALSRSWSTSVSPERRMYARLVEGDVAAAAGKLGEAVRAYEDGARLADTWVVHKRLGEAHLANRAWQAALTELTACWARRGEGVLFAMPSLHFLPEVLFGIARAKEGLSSADAAVAYEALLAIEPDAQADPLAIEARARLATLAAQPPKIR